MYLLNQLNYFNDIPLESHCIAQWVSPLILKSKAPSLRITPKHLSASYPSPYYENCIVFSAGRGKVKSRPDKISQCEIRTLRIINFGKRAIIVW